MTVITKITTQKNSAERFNVYIDQGKGEEFAFGVDANVLIQYDLKKGRVLDEFELAEIQFADEEKKAYNLAVTYLSYRMRSEKEVRDYLKKKEVGDMIVQQVIQRLDSHRYLNDEEFAKAYVLTQVNTTSKGPSVIKRELQEKGVKPDIVQSTLEHFSKEEQIETVMKLIAKLKGKYKKYSEIVMKQKIEQFLVNKGYSFSIINEAMQHVDVEKNSDEEWQALTQQGMKAHRKYAKYSGWEYEQKMKQNLYRKGFSIDQIEAFISSLEEE
ncbi:recombination regulator RecX [Priestia flexa]|uniref:recombination regulator RecX n=1 Tax=Priestia flexa TaxID=86664 RepID=UPI000C23CF7A|nr:recombination regulator RecX [Priestia flexa]MCA1202798.1 recombination regulator RecX [Priestia flexa]MEC0668433.1 recombination regulator RecX [Priestia flexa]MED3824065.1 recombination regulator RecX [Priestia flexa]